jgi:hypothetical protein
MIHWHSFNSDGPILKKENTSSSPFYKVQFGKNAQTKETYYNILVYTPT